MKETGRPGRTAMSWERTTASFPPGPSTLNSTSNSPAVVYSCTGDVSSLWLPSPKSHLTAEIWPVEVCENLTVSGAAPSSTSTEKSADGGGIGVGAGRGVGVGVGEGSDVEIGVGVGEGSDVGIGTIVVARGGAGFGVWAGTDVGGRVNVEVDSGVVSHAWVGAGPTVAVDSTDSVSPDGVVEPPSQAAKMPTTAIATTQ